MNTTPKEYDGNGGLPETDLLDDLLAKRSYHQAAAADTPLRKLRHNMQVSTMYGLVITMGYALLIFYFPIWQVQLGLLVVIAFNILLMVQGFRFQAALDKLMLSGAVLETLKAVRDRFRRWFRQQYRMAIFVYPVAASAGFMLGGTLGSGKPIEVFMASEKVQLAWLISIAVLLPLCMWLARWLNRKAFGQYVDQLQETIDALESQS
jgi:hypothetical protein